MAAGGAAGELMGPAGNGDDDDGAAYGCADNGEPLVGDESHAAHESDTGGNEEESDVMDQKVGEFFYLPEFYGSDLEGAGQ